MFILMLNSGNMVMNEALCLHRVVLIEGRQMQTQLNDTAYSDKHYKML
jgi:hypothetical protein